MIKLMRVGALIGLSLCSTACNYEEDQKTREHREVECEGKVIDWLPRRTDFEIKKFESSITDDWVMKTGEFSAYVNGKKRNYVVQCHFVGYSTKTYDVLIVEVANTKPRQKK